MSATRDWQRAVLAFVTAHPDHPCKPRAVARELRVPNSDYTTFRGAVRALLDDGALVLGPGRTLRLPLRGDQIVGTFRANRRGFGFVERPGLPTLYIDERRTGGALDGDTVLARVLRSRGTRTEAEVVRVVERAPRNWVGLLERRGAGWVVQPHGRDPLPVVHVGDPAAHGARAGDLVVVEPDERTLHGARVRGTILERLGDASDARTWILGVLRRYGIADDFPPAVRQAAQRAAKRFDPDDIGTRVDLRGLATFTIDPPDARDFDDAISIEALPGRNLRLGVHIADVAHFVPAGGVIDCEARQRSTSVYFPGRVVPMLPEALSAGVCSLQPEQSRLTKSVFLTYDDAGRVVETRLANTVIRSNARLTYQQITAALEDRHSALPSETVSQLQLAATLARRIQRRRLKQGMLVLTLPEVEIRLDEQGHVVDAGPGDTGFSHTLIEMFMVEANEAVSRALTQAGLPHLRRIHPSPDPEAAKSLAQLAPILGHRPPTNLARETILKLLGTVRGRPEETAVNFVLLRTLAQASYGPAREGHFALASDDYCHFTSPIRRYPDLTIHRLFDVLVAPRRGKRPAAAVLPEIELESLGVLASAAERRAQEAEREADQQLLLMLMRAKVGEVFEAIVTGVASFGIFVQVRPYMAEGVVQRSDLGPDDWDYDRQAGLLIGRRTRQMVHLGQLLRVQVVGVDEVWQRLRLVPARGEPVKAVAASGCIIGAAPQRRRKRR